MDMLPDIGSLVASPGLPALAPLSTITDPSNQDGENPPNELHTGLRNDFFNVTSGADDSVNDPLMHATRQTLATMSPVYAQKHQIVPPQPQQSFQQSPVPVMHDSGHINPDFLSSLLVKQESGGNYTARNGEKGSTASGKYQYTDATWNGYGGYAKAMLAPPAVQDQKFREDIANRMARYNGNPFKVIAAHYQPARADNPRTWNDPVKGNRGKTAVPVAQYVAQVVHNTPLEQSFQQYMRNPQ